MTAEIGFKPELASTATPLLIISGAAASGKDVFVKRFLEKHPDYSQIVSYTSRPRRKIETEGVDYHYLTESEFRQRASQMCTVVVRQVEDQRFFYGTDIADIRKVLLKKPALWKLDLGTACNLSSELEDSMISEELNALQSAAKIIYLGTERLAVLKDRYFARVRSVDNRQEFRHRLMVEWDCWKSYRDRIDLTVINKQNCLDQAIQKVEQFLG